MEDVKARLTSLFIKALIFLLLTQVFLAYAMAQESQSMSEPSHLIRNPVSYNNLPPKAGDFIILKLRLASELNPLESEQKRYEHQLQSNRQSGAIIHSEPYARYRIIRTWEDFNRTPEAARKHNFHMFGTKPLRPMEVEIEEVTRQGRERIYHIAEVALTEGISSHFFRISDEVMFPETRSGFTAYKDGTVIGIYGNGDLAVKKGLEYQRVKPHNLFAKKRLYTEHQSTLQPNQEVSYRFERQASDLISYEDARVLAINPLGEALIRVNRTNQVLRLTVEQQVGESGNTQKPALIVTREEASRLQSDMKSTLPVIRVAPRISTNSNSAIIFQCYRYFHAPK